VAKWIQDDTKTKVFVPGGTETLIELREIHGTRTEAFTNVSGNPVYKVKLECPVDQYYYARACLLGGPEKWPFSSAPLNIDPILQPVCVSVEAVTDGTKATTDSDKQILNYINKMLLDVTFLPRVGDYIIDHNSQHVYYEDKLEHVNETRPLSNLAFCWGLTTETAPTQAQAKVLTHQEVPVLFEPGFTLTHTIEGWCRDIPETLRNEADDADITAIGTVNQHEYESLNLHRKFPAKTLLLRAIIAESAFSFRSYWYPGAPSTTPNRDLGGKPTVTLRLIYQYKKDGWQRFYRVPIGDGAAPPGLYYIRRNDQVAGYPPYTPFPVANHKTFLFTGTPV